MLQSLYIANNYSNHTNSSTDAIGASLSDALERYRKYERKLKDNVKPTEETLKRLSSGPLIEAKPQQPKNTSSGFPNGGENYL